MIDNVKGEVAALGLDPYDDFKDMEDHAESALLKVILGNDDFIETVSHLRTFSLNLLKSVERWTK